MENRIIINQEKNSKSVFLYQNNELVEQYTENNDKKRLEGNVYNGKVVNVIKGMQYAFVDIGTEKNALIHIKDLIPKQSNTTGNNNIDTNGFEISNFIKPNDNIIVQVKRDSIKNKGARITKDIKLTGKYLVLMPYAEFISISKKIVNEKNKKMLIKIAKELLKQEQVHYGIIIRTSAENLKEDEIKADFYNLVKLWENIIEKARNTTAPYKLHSDYGIVGKLITDFEPLGLEIITNSQTEKKNIELINPNIPVTIDKSINQTIEEKQKIWLKCGGFITIDKTEALVAIDVNSGKCLGKRGLEDTVLKVNEQAVYEIAKQIRLRDLGGTIIIDFIDMVEEKDRNSIIELMKQEIKKDRAKVQVFEFTKLGLLEMTRKNIFRK